MLTDRLPLQGHAHDSTIERRIDATTWGLLLLMTGILLLFPRQTVPDGTWLLLAGVILLGASAIRYAMHVEVSTFIVVLATIAIAAGISSMAGVDLPLLAMFLVLIGATIMFRTWLGHHESKPPEA